MQTNLKAPRKKYDEAFKRSAVDLLLHGGQSVKELAGELGVSSEAESSRKLRALHGSRRVLTFSTAGIRTTFLQDMLDLTVADATAANGC